MISNWAGIVASSPFQGNARIMFSPVQTGNLLALRAFDLVKSHCVQRLLVLFMDGGPLSEEAIGGILMPHKATVHKVLFSKYDRSE